MNLVLVLVTLFSVFCNIGLIIASLRSNEWAKLGNGKDFTIYQCVDCDPLQENWNFECLARSFCANSLEPGLCSLYSDLYKASYAYLILELASLVFSLMFLEKLLLLAFKSYVGSKLITILSALGMFILHLAGTFFWLGFTDATSNCDKPEGKDRPDICYSSGLAIAISNCILMLLTVCLFIFSSCRTRYLDESAVVNGQFCGISIRKWAWISLIFTIIGVILILACLTINTWVESSHFKGSLTRCEKCNDLQWLSWGCLKGTECSINPDSENCIIYSNLYRAESIFLILQAVCIILAMLFLQVLTAFAMGQDYGVRCLNYVKAI